MTYELANTCPYCKNTHECASESKGDIVPPSPGDASVCWECGQVSLFDDKLVLRKPTDEERTQLDQDKDVAFAKSIFAKKGRIG